MGQDPGVCEVAAQGGGREAAAGVVRFREEGEWDGLGGLGTGARAVWQNDRCMKGRNVACIKGLTLCTP